MWNFLQKLSSVAKLDGLWTVVEPEHEEHRPVELNLAYSRFINLSLAK